MKLKAVVSPNLPIRLVRALVDPKLNTWYIEEIVKKRLHSTEVNPAGHYIQWPDFSVEWENGECGIEVSFSKLSASFKRSGNDFHNARVAIQQKFVQLIEHNLPSGRSCWLFVASQTDKPIQGRDGSETTMHELSEIRVEGKAIPDEEGDVPAGNFSLKPLR